MSELQDLVKRFYATFADNDMVAAEACFTRDGASPGVAAWRGFTERIKGAAPDAQLSVVAAVQEGDRIAVEGALTGTFTAPMQLEEGTAAPTGNHFTLLFADVFDTEDGAIATHRVYYDQADFMGQLGLLPDSG